MAPGNGEFNLVAADRVNWLLPFKNRGPGLLDFTVFQKNLVIWLCIWNLILICWLIFFKDVTWLQLKYMLGSHLVILKSFFFPKKFLNSWISFLSEDRKVWSIFQQHCEVRLEYKVTESLLDWVLDENHFYSTTDTIQDAEVIAVNRTSSSHGCLQVLYPKWDTQ